MSNASPAKNRDAVPKNFMTGRATAPKVVVVHAGKIIVDERVGVDTFHVRRREEARFSLGRHRPRPRPDRESVGDRLPPAKSE